MLPSVTQVIAQTDVIRYMLTRPIVKGRIGKWTMALSEFSLQYVARKLSRARHWLISLLNIPPHTVLGATTLKSALFRRATTTGRCTLTTPVRHLRRAWELSFNPRTTITGYFRLSWISNAPTIRPNMKP
ncbi:hypothetical protein ACFX1W_039934 [Malus domestica]